MTHYFKNLTTEQHTDEAGYRIEEGVIVEPADRREIRDYYAERSRYYYPGSEEKAAEEARWAARSGPVTVRTTTPERNCT